MSSIRLAHFSDTHLGYRALTRQDPVTGRNQRSSDVDWSFERTVDNILAQGVDAIIHSGDVFHHARPTWQSLRHFIRQMRKIEDAGIPTLVIAGNHDTPRIRTGGSAYSVLELALPKITFVADYESVHDTTTFAALDLHVQAVPHGALTNPDPVLTQSMPGKRNILVSHGMAPGILAPGVHTEPGEITIGSNLYEAEGFDYIALGHYHVKHHVAAHAWYSGATERFGWGDYDVDPGWALVTLGKPGDPPEFEHVPISGRPMLSLKPVYGNNLPAEDIATNILHQLATEIDDPRTMVRCLLRDADRNTWREVDRLLRRQTDQYCWSFYLAKEQPSFTAQGENRTQTTAELDLHALFAEFVEERKGSPYSASFAKAFLERGSRALTDAAIAQEQPTPEGDTLS